MPSSSTPRTAVPFLFLSTLVRARGQRIFPRPIRNLCVVLCVICGLGVSASHEARAGTPGPGEATAIFAAGVTNLDDTRAVAVFTSDAPAQATLRLTAGGKEIQSITEKEPALIHHIPLAGLATGTSYSVEITAPGKNGQTIRNSQISFTARRHPAHFDHFEHKTLMGVQTSSDPVMLKKLGVGLVRYSVTWDKAEPQRGVWDEALLKQMVGEVDAFNKAGIEPLFILCFSVPWAKTETDRLMKWRHPAFGPPDNLADWNAYVSKIMTLLKGKVRYYEIWNEPDAGYLATGKPAERQDINETAPTNPYTGNIDYWIGDRYVPLIAAAREIADGIDKNIHILAGSWNRDYSGSRGNICFGRGMGDYIQQYSFHNYTGRPFSYTAWKTMTDSFFSSTDRIFKKYDKTMPIAVTEWGIQTYDSPRPGDGFSSRRDGQIFLFKSVFYYFSMERVSQLVLHHMGFDDEWSLVNKGADGSPQMQPMFSTYQWLCQEFGGKIYKALSVDVNGVQDAPAYGVQIEGGPVYIAVWQEKWNGAKPVIQPEQTASIQIEGLSGKWTREQIDLTGKASGATEVDGASAWNVTLPAQSDSAESLPLVYRLVKAGK